jgi:hypothetical protein
MSDAQIKEVERNYAEFTKLLPTIDHSRANKFALMKDGKIIDFFSTAEDARTAATHFIRDGIFSIQKVSRDEINLGFYNNAIPVN